MCSRSNVSWEASPTDRRIAESLPCISGGSQANQPEQIPGEVIAILRPIPAQP